MNDQSRQRLEQSIRRTFPQVSQEQATELATAISDCTREEIETSQQAFVRNQQRTQDQTPASRR